HCQIWRALSRVAWSRSHRVRPHVRFLPGVILGRGSRRMVWRGASRHRRRAMEQSTRFIGMDVHKNTIVVAVTATGDIGKATAYGTFPNTAAALGKLVRRLRQAGDGPLKFCYEAGPCGYGVHRTLTKLLGYAHISCRVRIGIRKRLRAYDAVRFGSLRQPEDTNRNGLVAWIIRGC